MLEQKLEYLLKEYFHFDLAAEKSELVKEAATLLPFVSRWRGDFGFVSNLLGALMDCEVEMLVNRYSHLDTTICWLPQVRYNLLIPGLTPDQYKQQMSDLEPLVKFLKEWLIPFDVMLEVKIKEHKDARASAVERTLDYNTELKH